MGETPVLLYLAHCNPAVYEIRQNLLDRLLGRIVVRPANRYWKAFYKVEIYIKSPREARFYGRWVSGWLSGFYEIKGNPIGLMQSLRHI